MKIQYKIKIKNPVRDSLKNTDELSSEGYFFTSENGLGLTLSGVHEARGIYRKGFTYGYKGTTHALSEGSELFLDNTEGTFLDVEALLAVVGQRVTDPSFKTVQEHFKIARRVGGKEFALDTFVERPSDVFIVFTDGSEIYPQDGTIKEASNIYTTRYELPENYLVLYAKISEGFKIDTDDFLFIPRSDFHKVPTGFCSLSIGTVTEVPSITAKEGFVILYTPTPSKVSLASYLNLDGTPRKNYTTTTGERLIVEPSSKFNPVFSSNLNDNLTCIYKLSSDGVAELTLIVDNLNLVTSTSNSSALALYNELLKADPEFLKKYVQLQYKTHITVPGASYDVLNKELLQGVLNGYSELVVKI